MCGVGGGGSLLPLSSRAALPCRGGEVNLGGRRQLREWEPGRRGALFLVAGRRFGGGEGGPSAGRGASAAGAERRRLWGQLPPGGGAALSPPGRVSVRRGDVPGGGPERPAGPARLPLAVRAGRGGREGSGTPSTGKAFKSLCYGEGKGGGAPPRGRQDGGGGPGAAPSAGRVRPKGREGAPVSLLPGWVSLRLAA